MGVVADTRYRELFNPRPSAYFPLGRIRVMAPTRLLVGTVAAGQIDLPNLVREAFAVADPQVRVLGEDRVVEVLRRAGARQRCAEALLFGVSSVDPGTYIVVITASLGTALVAGLVPALQAAKADPAFTLPAE